MMIRLLAICFAMLGLPASAATLYECIDPTRADGPVLRLLINTRTARGPAGEHWRMIHRGTTYSGETGASQTTAKTSRSGDIEIVITFDTTPTGPVGQRLVITGTRSSATLTEYNVGGFTGPIQLGAYPCTKQKRYCGTLLGGD